MTLLANETGKPLQKGGPEATIEATQMVLSTKYVDGL